MSQKSIFCVSSSGLYNCPYSVGHASYWSLTPSDRNLTPFIDQCLWQFIEVMASCIPNCFSKVSPQIFYWIEMRTLWWPFQTTHVLVRFPMLDNVSSVAWGTIVLENKVISISQKMCWGNGRVPENIQIAILVKVAFQWSEKPFLCTALHPTQSQRHHQISLWVQHNCFCMLHGIFSSQTPDHHFEREWILTHYSKAQLTNLHVPLRIVTFSCGVLLLSKVFSKPHVPQDQLQVVFEQCCLMLGCHPVSIQFLSVGLSLFCSVVTV